MGTSFWEIAENMNEHSLMFHDSSGNYNPVLGELRTQAYKAGMPMRLVLEKNDKDLREVLGRLSNDATDSTELYR
jgi:hypothetical protein